MIISHRYRFIFIKTLKTAGTSLEVYLSQQCGPEDVLTPISPHVAPHVARNHEGFFNHISASRVKSIVPERIWNDYFKFCVERNPWDKTLSHFHMEKSLKRGELSFDAYLANGSFAVNHPLYMDLTESQVLVDRVLGYESLRSDLSEVFCALGVPFAGSLNVTAKGEYRMDRRPYQEVYTPSQREIVAHAFAREIELHGYRF